MVFFSSLVATRVRVLRPGIRVLHLWGWPLLRPYLSHAHDQSLLKPFRLPDLVDKVPGLLPGQVPKMVGDRSV
jgi:hypothetical protein